MSNIIPFRRASRVDGFVNRITGYGTSRDHGQQFTWSMDGRRFSRHQLEDIYARDELAWKIVDILPDNALRKGWHYPTLDEAKEKKLKRILKDSKFKQALNRGLKLNAVYGAVLYVPIEDGGTDEDEVNFDAIRSIGEVQVIERDYISPEDLKRSLRFTHYRIQMQDKAGAEQYVRVHRSRIIQLPGANASGDWLVSNDGWPPSKLERCVEPLIARAAAHGVIPNVLKDIIRDVIGLQGLNELSLNDCEEDQQAFNDRLDAMFLAQSLLNKLVLDKEDTYTRQVTPMAGVPDVVRLTDNRVVTASGLPHTTLLGEKPGASIGEGGQSQDRELNKATECYQHDCVLPPVDAFHAFCAPLIGEEDIETCFNPLDAPTKKESAEVFKLMAEAAAIMVREGIASPAEGATFCDGDDVLTTLKLDMDTRATLEKEAQEQLEDLMKVPEEPEPLAPGQIGALNAPQKPQKPE